MVFQSLTYLSFWQDQYPEFRRIWEEEMLLIRADDTAFWQMEEPDVKWDPQVICLQTKDTLLSRLTHGHGHHGHHGHYGKGQSRICR